MGSTTTPYDASIVNQPNFMSPPIVDGLQTPFNDMGNSRYDLNSGADTIDTGLQAGYMDLSNLPGSESAMNTQNLPPGSLMGARLFGVNAIASAGAVGIVTTATFATPFLHHVAHKSAEMLGKNGFGQVYYKVVDHKKSADVGAALPREAEIPRDLSPPFVAVNRSTSSTGSWGETVKDTAPDVRATVVPTPTGSSDIEVNKKNTRKNPFRTARSAKQRIPVEVSPGSPDHVLRAIAVSTFCGQQEGDLSFREGDILDILERTNHGKDWWLGRKGSTVGTFLSDMVQILNTVIAKYSLDGKEED
jgi:SH3 domain